MNTIKNHPAQHITFAAIGRKITKWPTRVAVTLGKAKIPFLDTAEQLTFRNHFNDVKVADEEAPDLVLVQPPELGDAAACRTSPHLF